MNSVGFYTSNNVEKRVYDLSAVTNVDVYLNDELLNLKTFKDYMLMFYDTPPSEPIYEICGDRWKVGVIYDYHSGYGQISFVNGTYISGIL